jgi:branched-chain amino acid transport system permease protein
MRSLTSRIVSSGRIGSSGRSRSLAPLGIAALVGLAIMVWTGSNGYRQDLVVLAATYGLVALGMYVPFVMAGSLSMAYSAYAGVGAYAVGYVATESGLPLWLAWLIAPVLSAVLAVVLGFATRRLSGFYLAAVTLLFGTAFETWLTDAEGITGGSGGIGGIRGIAVFGWEPDRHQQVVASVVLVLLMGFAVDRLRQSPWGVMVRSLREVPQVVETAGVRVPVLNLVALAIGAMIASLGGCLFASFVGGVTPETFTLSIVFLAVFMPLIGGAGTPWGALLGAVIVVELTLDFPAFSESGTLILALGVIVILLVAPRGVIGYVDAARGRLLRLLPAGAAGTAGTADAPAPGAPGTADDGDATVTATATAGSGPSDTGGRSS